MPTAVWRRFVAPIAAIASPASESVDKRLAAVRSYPSRSVLSELFPNAVDLEHIKLIVQLFI